MGELYPDLENGSNLKNFNCINLTIIDFIIYAIYAYTLLNFIQFISGIFNRITSEAMASLIAVGLFFIIQIMVILRSKSNPKRIFYTKYIIIFIIILNSFRSGNFILIFIFMIPLFFLFKRPSECKLNKIEIIFPFLLILIILFNYLFGGTI